MRSFFFSYVHTSPNHKVMFEDVRQNRLLEALALYEQVVSNPIFR